MVLSKEISFMNHIKRVVKCIPQVKRVTDARNYHIEESERLNWENRALQTRNSELALLVRNQKNLIVTLNGL